MISDSCQLNEILKLGMSQYFSRDCVLPWVLDHTLWAATLVVLDLDHARRETLLELFLVFWRDRRAEDYMGKKAV